MEIFFIFSAEEKKRFVEITVIMGNGYYHFTDSSLDPFGDNIGFAFSLVK